jgi:hypothetical protein
VRSGGLRPDESHRDDSRDGRTQQPDGRASLAFGVKSRTPTSEAFAEREIFASALLSKQELYSTPPEEAINILEE